MASSIFVRPDGGADVVARAPGGTLMYHWATPGSAWRSTQVAGPGTTSVPSIFVRPDGEADVAVQGPDFSLTYHWATPGSASRRSTQVAGAGAVYSAPSLVVRPDGQADIVARGPRLLAGALLGRARLPLAGGADRRGGDGRVHPSIFARPDGRADVVAQGPDSSLVHYWATPGSPWHTAQIAGPRTTYSAPSLAVRPDGQTDVVVRGPGDTLMHYSAAPGSRLAQRTGGRAGTTVSPSAPSISCAPMARPTLPRSAPAR